jgi:hypothetical protein
VLVGAGGTLTANGGLAQTGGDLSLSGNGAVNVNGMFQQGGGTTEVAGTATLSAYSLGVGGTLTLEGGALSASLGGVQVASDGTLIVDSGTITAGMGGVQVGSGGILTLYTGNLHGGLSNFGTVNLGDPTTAGTFAITGNYTQSGMGTLNAYLGGTSAGSYSQLRIGGQANLGGTLNVSYVNGFAAAPGNAFTLLTYGSGSGTFGTLHLPGLGTGAWDPVYAQSPGSFTLEVTS